MQLQPIDLNSDSRIIYNGKWPRQDGGRVANATGLTAMISFSGTYIEVHGRLSIKEGPHPSLMGEVFSIDGLHPSNSYGIQPKPLVNGTFNLTSLSLEEREHHLVIKCTKELDQLWLGSIVYLPADTGSGTGLSKGTVAGVVVGVVGFIILLAALLVWLWKRRMKRLRREHVITPFGHPLASASNVLASEIQDSSITSLTTLHRKSPLPQAQPTLQTPTPFPHRQMSSPAPPPYPGHTNRK